MTDRLPFLAATDKDIFDLLMSSRIRMSDSVLRSIAISRGIIYSSKTKRERLVSDISLLTHDFMSITKMIEKREQVNKNEKRSYIEIPVTLSHEEIKKIIDDYKKNVSDSEEVNIQRRRSHDAYVNITYNEFDYSKTRLIQKQRRDAGIEFVIGEDKTTIRMPATEKARGIVDKFVLHASKIKLQNISQVGISLEGLTSDQRNTFFINLMRNIPDYQLQTVVNIKCATDDGDISDDFDLDIEQREHTPSSEIVSKINSVALSGMHLLQSEEYQTLRRNGFFITAVTWRASQNEPPQNALQFDVAFDEPREGKGFRFGVRIARRLADGTLTSDYKPLEPLQQPIYWGLMERTSSSVLQEILTAPADSGASTDGETK